MQVFEVNGVWCIMSKNCIFNDKRICSNCGECEVCELNSNKKCDNCGKCLELEGYDVKAIKIDEVFEDEVLLKSEDSLKEKNEVDLHDEEGNTENEIDELSTFEEGDLLLVEEEYSRLNDDDIPENDEVWEYIDDIEGAKELLENEEDNQELLHEEFPGLIRLNI